jgi:hypothetical protein
MAAPSLFAVDIAGRAVLRGVPSTGTGLLSIGTADDRLFELDPEPGLASGSPGFVREHTFELFLYRDIPLRAAGSSAPALAGRDVAMSDDAGFAYVLTGRSAPADVPQDAAISVLDLGVGVPMATIPLNDLGSSLRVFRVRVGGL